MAEKKSNIFFVGPGYCWCFIFCFLQHWLTTVSIKACLAHWNMPQIEHSTEAVCYYCRFELTNYAFSNCDISETKKDTADPLVPKCSSRTGLSPTLSWKWPRPTLSSSFGPFSALFQLWWPRLGAKLFLIFQKKWAWRAPGSPLAWSKEIFACRPIMSACEQLLWSLSFWHHHARAGADARFWLFWAT